MIRLTQRQLGATRRAGYLLICLFITVFSVSRPVNAQSDLDNSLTINVLDIDELVGQIQIMVYNTADTWLETPVYKKALTVKSRRVQWAIHGVQDGEYAVKVYHDQDNNGNHDSYLFGIPKEPYAYSNNVRGFLGTPSWGQAKILVSSDHRNVDILLR